MIGAIKFAKYYELGEDDWVVTIFTDSMDLYLSRVEELAAEHGAYAEVSAARALNWPVKEKPRGSSLTGRKVETVALYISIDGLGGSAYNDGILPT
jgi:hypothetical protein